MKKYYVKYNTGDVAYSLIETNENHINGLTFEHKSDALMNLLQSVKNDIDALNRRSSELAQLERLLLDEIEKEKRWWS